MHKEWAKKTIGCDYTDQVAHPNVSADDEGSYAYHGLVERSGIFLYTPPKPREVLPLCNVYSISNGAMFHVNARSMRIHTCQCRGCRRSRGDHTVLYIYAKQGACNCDMSGTEPGMMAYTYIKNGGPVDAIRRSQLYRQRERLWSTDVVRPSGVVVCSSCLEVITVVFCATTITTGIGMRANTISIRVRCPRSSKKYDTVTLTQPKTRVAEGNGAHFAVTLN